MLNIDLNSRSKTQFMDKDSHFELNLDISPEIKIEKRKVTSLPSLFGEIGGLFDFFVIFILLVISNF